MRLQRIVGVGQFGQHITAFRIDGAREKVHRRHAAGTARSTGLSVGRTGQQAPRGQSSDARLSQEHTARQPLLLIPVNRFALVRKFVLHGSSS